MRPCARGAGPGSGPGAGARRASGWRCRRSWTGTCTCGGSRRCTPSGTRASGWGTVPAARARRAGVAVRRRPGGPAVVGSAAGGGVRRWAGLDARARAGRRRSAASATSSTTRTSTSTPRGRRPTCRRRWPSTSAGSPSTPPASWPVHVAGHPPGALTFFVAAGPARPGRRPRGRPRGHADRGLHGGRRAGDPAGARRRAARPAGRAVPGGRAGRDLAVRVGRRDVRRRARPGGCARSRWPPYVAASPWSVVAGLLLGWCVMISYGLPLLGLLAVAVLVVARSWRPLPCRRRSRRWPSCSPTCRSGSPGGRRCPCCASATGTGSPTTARRRTGCGATSPPSPSAPVRSPSPASRHTLARVGRPAADARRVVARGRRGTAMVVAADLSQMSKAEVERIWLPFVPWLLIGCALLPERWRRWGLGAPGGRRAASCSTCSARAGDRISRAAARWRTSARPSLGRDRAR